MRRLLIFLVCSSALSGLASAQNLRLDVNAGVQLLSTTATQDFTVAINQEDASIVNDIDLSGGGFFDAGAAYKIGRQLWLGGNVSFLSRTVGSHLVAQIPHPFYFSQPRTIEGDVTGLKNTETGIHISIGYERPLTQTVDITYFAGPSFFTVKQGIATNVNYDSVYPFDTATFASATTGTATGTLFGFNAGADISKRMSRTVSVAGLIRFTRGSGTVATGTNELDTTAGGLMAGAGVRLRF